jgi:HEAT repeats
MPFIDIMTEGSPELDAFAREVTHTLEGANLRTAFWKCSDAFEALVGSSFLKNIGHGFMQTMLDTPTRASGQWQVHHAVLVQHPSFALRVTWSLVDGPHEATIASHAAHSMICSVGTEPVVIDMYRMPAVDLEVFEIGAALEFSHQVVLAPRQILELDGQHWVPDARSSAGNCLITFTSTPIGSQVWSFDRSSRQSWAVSASSQEATQIKETLGILRRFKLKEAAPTVDRLCAHPHHDVRWEAIKTLGVLDAALAIERLRQASSDTHPHVRASAARTLSTLEAG